MIVSNNLLDKADTYPLRGICMLMIFFHHAFNRYTNVEFASLGENLLINQLYSVRNWGFLATGVFFFLSGFGLYHSLLRNSPLRWDYLFQHLKKLFKPFIFLWVFILGCFVVYAPEYLNFSLFADFFTLCSPGRDTWFFKIIIAAYIISFFSFKYIKSENVRFLVIFACTFAYMAVMFKLGYGRWWFNSILNFPVGMLVARFYNKIDTIPDLLVLLAGALVYFLFFHFMHGKLSEIMQGISFSFVIVYAVKYINIRSNYLYFVGSQSLAFYFLENPVRRFICNPYVENYWLLVLASIAVTSAFVWAYSKFDSKILKK